MGKQIKPGYIILLLLYIAALVATNVLARVSGFLMIGESRLPVSAFTGVVSTLANICIMLIVVFYKKLGFITALILLGSQFPLLFIGIVLRRETTNIPGVFGCVFTILVSIIIYRRNRSIEEYQQSEIEHLKAQRQFSQRLFEQTATSMINAIDAKDTYSHGHSQRVAEYSEKIAREMGKNDEECYRIYYSALLHDVGKIGIDDRIINKNGKLTPEEYEIIKKHPDMGNQILSSISEYPYLSIGAHYHHERYDGKGYPQGLKGDDIPEIARIISVADAYDAMTSNRSYRETLPQQLVREEIVKGAGTQFDPKIARVMQHLIDLDSEYEMKERNTLHGLAGKNELRCGVFRDLVTGGVVLSNSITRIHVKYTPDDRAEKDVHVPAIILFDSLDGRVHDDEKTIRDLLYYEYCEIGMDGMTEKKGVREIRVDSAASENPRKSRGSSSEEKVYEIEGVKVRDHAMIKVDDGSRMIKVIVALPDNSRFVYVGLTGESCRISDMHVTTSEEEVPERYIPRLVDEVSYIDDPSGDVPNVQIDGYRTDSTNGIPVTDGMKIRFHAKSLPTARLVWHCPYIVLFFSRDGKVDGGGYIEYALVRLDGEEWKDGEAAENYLTVEQGDGFKGWNEWKDFNKKGFDCEVNIRRNGKEIILSTENFGLSVTNKTHVLVEADDVYVSLSGDQCALTRIRISR